MSTEKKSEQRPPGQIGHWGEALVARWLEAQSWLILDRRWHCRWGELDLVAQSHLMVPGAPLPTLAFVEVKTRSRGNWDADGLLAVTPRKQVKLGQTAQLFLADRPDLAHYPCRFDVALIRYQPVKAGADAKVAVPPQAPELPTLQLGQPILMHNYQWILQDYIVAAFDLA